MTYPPVFGVGETVFHLLGRLVYGFDGSKAFHLCTFVIFIPPLSSTSFRSSLLSFLPRSVPGTLSASAARSALLVCVCVCACVRVCVRPFFH